MRLAALCGSLRKGSLNAAPIDAVAERQVRSLIEALAATGLR